MFNDIWSLGIILLNLITGRNPWKSASVDDCTFQAYLKDPLNFLPTVLPISQEVNDLLTRVLHVDWRHRSTLREMRQAVKEIENFYSPDVLFEDSMARCPWEAGVNVGDEEEEEESDSTGVGEPEPEHGAETQNFHAEEVSRRSQWSRDSEMVYTTQSSKYSWDGAISYADDFTGGAEARSMSPSSRMYARRHFNDLRSSSGPSTYSVVSSSPSIPSPPVTPDPEDSLFRDIGRRPNHLTLDIDGLRSKYYAGSINMVSAVESSSAMQTALESSQYEYGPYSSFFYAESEKQSATVPSADDMGMIITPTDYFDDEEMDTLSVYSYPNTEAYDSSAIVEPMSARPESPVLGLDFGFPSAATSAVDLQSQDDHSQFVHLQSESNAQTPAYSFLSFLSPNSSGYAPSFNYPPLTTPTSLSPTVTTNLGSPFEYTPPAVASSSKSSSSRRSRSRSRKSRLLNPMRLAFTRRSRSPSPPPSSSFQQQPLQGDAAKATFSTHWTLATSVSPDQQSLSCFATPASSPKSAAADSSSTALPHRSTQGIRRRATKKRLRSPRDWFSPGKLFAAVMPSP